VIGNRYGPGTGTIWLDDVQCVGNEIAITTCVRAQTHDCDHSEDVSVLCGTSPVQYGNLCDNHVLRLKCGKCSGLRNCTWFVWRPMSLDWGPTATVSGAHKLNYSIT